MASTPKELCGTSVSTVAYYEAASEEGLSALMYPGTQPYNIYNDTLRSGTSRSFHDLHLPDFLTVLPANVVREVPENEQRSPECIHCTGNHDSYIPKTRVQRSLHLV